MLSTRRKAYAKRSRTGCRTCRARHVKCDESPGACQNCISTGRTCGGYEVHRLPRGRASKKIPIEYSILPRIAHGLCWVVTSDESRCLSFFQHRSIPGLVGFYDSPLWQHLVLQMSYSEPAVYHAVVALGAINHAQEKTGIPRPGQPRQNIWYQFALEQSARSITLLNKRRMSQDPKLQEVILVCCLLYITCELLRGHYDNACAHIFGGLQILKELNIRRRISGVCVSPVEQCVVETFLHLQMQSAFFGTGAPLTVDRDLVYEQSYEEYLLIFRSLENSRLASNPLLHTAFPFVSYCMRRSDADIMAEYGTLQQTQLQLLSYLTRFLRLLKLLSDESYRSLNDKEQLEVDMTNLLCVTAVHALKTCLCSKSSPLPQDLVLGSRTLLSLAEAATSKFQARPTIMLDSTIVPALFFAAFRCPDYGVRWRAIDLLRSWEHSEGFLNAAVVADVLEQNLRIELNHLRETKVSTCRLLPPRLSFVTKRHGQSFARMSYMVGETEITRWLNLGTTSFLYASLGTVQSS
ncbi:C6 zinc finger domain protein, partial [Aspergillus pseudotamarii]